MDYHFLTKEDFLLKIERGEMLEYAQVHGNHYGTLKSTVKEALEQGTDVLLDIDVQGAMQIRKTDDTMLRDSLVDVFYMPPTIEELERRLRKRGTEDGRAGALATGDGARGIEAVAALQVHHFERLDGGGPDEIPGDHARRAVPEPEVGAERG